MLQSARERNIPVRPQIGRDNSMSASIKASDAMHAGLQHKTGVLPIMSRRQHGQELLLCKVPDAACKNGQIAVGCTAGSSGA